MPDDVEVDVVETDRGGKSTYHGPGQLVCYPILDLNRHGRDVKRYCRDLEEAVIRTLGAFGLEGTRIDGLTGVWLERPPRKIASIGVHVSRWVTTHGYALNVDLDPAPFTSWITACGLEDAAFTTMARELDRPLSVDDVRPAAVAALEEVFDLALEELPADEPRPLGPAAPRKARRLATALAPLQHSVTRVVEAGSTGTCRRSLPRTACAARSRAGRPRSGAGRSLVSGRGRGVARTGSSAAGCRSSSAHDDQGADASLRSDADRRRASRALRRAASRSWVPMTSSDHALSVPTEFERRCAEQQPATLLQG